VWNYLVIKGLMARALRVLVPGAWYHVVNRGIERRLIFHGEAYYEKFEELLGLMVQQFGVRIQSYVLMKLCNSVPVRLPTIRPARSLIRLIGKRGH
jgi:hypothetical protein